MNCINVTETSAQISIQIPYSFRDAFKSVFKTAQWNPTAKCWLVKNTTANKNKVVKFRVLIEPALVALDGVDELEMTERELTKLRAEADRIVRAQSETTKRIDEVNNQSSIMRTQIVALKSALGEKEIILNMALTELDIIKEERAKVMAPVIKYCVASDVHAAFEVLRGYAQHSFVLASDKKSFYSAQVTLSNAYKFVKDNFGVLLPALDIIGNASFNRMDRLKDYFIKYDDFFEKVEVV